MANVTSSDQARQPLLKKRYLKIFLTAFIVLVCGFAVISIASFIPRPSLYDPAYEIYQYLMQTSLAVAKLLIEIGLALFSVSSFIGALTDRSVSDNVKRGMMIASGIAILGLVVVFIYPVIYIY
ncbi:MAG: hypothetical protein ACXABG_10050 [Promethearchaeota archaeon]|jgi:hypothetical protein